MQNYLFFIHHAFGIKIHAFVLMPNHFHLLVTDPLGLLSKALNCFMKETSLSIGSDAGRINQVYGSRNYKCMIDSYHYFTHAYKYLYRNPVKAGLVETVEAYPYSTLHGLLGNSQLVIPVEQDLLLFNHFENTLNWLNTAPKAQHDHAVQKALRRSVFQIPRDSASFLHELETERF